MSPLGSTAGRPIFGVIAGWLWSIPKGVPAAALQFASRSVSGWSLIASRLSGPVPDGPANNPGSGLAPGCLSARARSCLAFEPLALLGRERHGGSTLSRAAPASLAAQGGGHAFRRQRGVRGKTSLGGPWLSGPVVHLSPTAAHCTFCPRCSAIGLLLGLRRASSAGSRRRRSATYGSQGAGRRPAAIVGPHIWVGNIADDKRWMAVAPARTLGEAAVSADDPRVLDAPTVRSRVGGCKAEPLR